MLVFFPIAAAWAFWAHGKNRPRPKRLLALAWVVLGAALCIAPVTARNWFVTGEPVLITAHGGINFYIGNNPRASGTFTPAAGHAAGGRPLEPRPAPARWPSGKAAAPV